MKLMQYFVLVCLSAFCLGCATNKAAAIRDKWVFVAVERAPFTPPAPTFDIMDFKDDRNVRLFSTIGAADFPATYSLTANTITFSFHPVGAKEPVSKQVKYRFANAKNDLSVEADKVEFLYMRASKLPPNTLSGFFRMDKDSTHTLELATDGSVRAEPGNIEGFYRQWESPVGPAVTMMMLLPDEGWISVTLNVKQFASDLIMAPISGGKIQDKQAIRWVREK